MEQIEWDEVPPSVVRGSHEVGSEARLSRFLVNVQCVVYAFPLGSIPNGNASVFESRVSMELQVLVEGEVSAALELAWVFVRSLGLPEPQRLLFDPCGIFLHSTNANGAQHADDRFAAI